MAIASVEKEALPPKVDSIEPAEDNAATSATPTEGEDESQEARPFKPDYRFWMIMLTLSFAVLLASMESTVVITSLPTIVAELNMGTNYIWVSNVFLLARYASFSFSSSSPSFLLSPF